MKRHKIVVSHQQMELLIEALEIAMNDWCDWASEGPAKNEYNAKVNKADKLSQRCKVLYWQEQQRLENK